LIIGAIIIFSFEIIVVTTDLIPTLLKKKEVRAYNIEAVMGP